MPLGNPLEQALTPIGVSDLLLVALIADAAQNAMASECTSLSEGLLLVSTMLLRDHALNAQLREHGVASLRGSDLP